MNFQNKMREKLCIDILNKNIIDPKRRELKPIIVDLISCIPNLKFLGYRNIPMDPVQDFKLTNVDYLHKTRNRNDIYVSMSDDVVENIEVYCILNEDIISSASLKVAKSLSKKFLKTIPKLDYIDEDIYNEIDAYDSGYASYDDNDYDGSLFVVFNLYIPRLINNVIRLNGNPYFNKFNIKEGAVLTRAGKLKCQHPIYVSYLVLDKTTETFKTQIFNYLFNSFMFVKNLNVIDDDFINDVTEDIPSNRKAFYKRVIQNTLNQANEIRNSVIPSEEMENFENAKDSIPSADILDAIRNFISVSEIGSQEFSMSLHSSIRIRFLKDMKKSLKLSSKRAKKQSASKIKGKINVDPRTVCTIIKNSNQFAYEKAANEVDTYHFFGYVSNLDVDDENISTNRRFERASLGIIDPIGSSASSENIGLTGMLVFNIPDKFLEKNKK